MTQGALLIDQRSASMTASDADLGLWARGRRVFVSSLIGDMKAERAAVREAIESFGATPVSRGWIANEASAPPCRGGVSGVE